jgi:hypothetical protein
VEARGWIHRVFGDEAQSSGKDIETGVIPSAADFDDAGADSGNEAAGDVDGTIETQHGARAA